MQTAETCHWLQAVEKPPMTTVAIAMTAARIPNNNRADITVDAITPQNIRAGTATNVVRPRTAPACTAV